MIKVEEVRWIDDMGLANTTKLVADAELVIVNGEQYLIHPTEICKEGELYLTSIKKLVKEKSNGVIQAGDKILALPEHFPPNNGWKEGKYMVECLPIISSDGDINTFNTGEYQIKRNSHITIYPVPLEEKMVPISLLEKCWDDSRKCKGEWNEIYDEPTIVFINNKKEWFEQNVK